MKAQNRIIEILEARIAPATLNLVGSLLTYTGGAGINNVLTLDISGANYTFADSAETITLNASAINAGFTGSGTNNISGPFSAVNSISMVLSDGNDTLNLNGLVDNFSMVNGAGTDTVNVATGASAVGTSVSLAAETVNINSLTGVTGLTISADTLAVNASVGFNGDLTIQPVTAGRPINLGTETAGSLSLTTAEMDNLLHSGTTQIGNTSAGAITISATFVGIAGTLSLKTGAGITDSAAGGIQVGALAIDADASVVLDGANDVGQLAALISDTGASFTYAEFTEFQIATVDGIGGITTDVGAGEFVSLSAGLPVTQAAGGNIITDGLRLLGNSSYTLTDLTNNVSTLAANVGGVLSYTDATGLIIGSVGGTAGITTSNDSVTLIALGGDITILNGNGTAAADIAVGSGKVSITAGAASADHEININANAGISATGAGTSISLKADRMVIGATLSAGSRAVSLSTFEAGTVVNLGGADAATILGLSSAELNFIAAAEIVVFGESSVNISATIALSNVGEFSLVAAGVSGAGSLSVAKLAIVSTGAVALNGANDVDQLGVAMNGGSPFPFSFADADGFSLGGLGTVLDPGNFSIISLNAGTAAVNVLGIQAFGFAVAGNTPGVNQDQLVVQGTVSLGSSSASFESVGTLAQGAEFVILSNDGTDAITGTFNGLPEGAFIPNFSPLSVITYAGGDGNDIAIKTLPPLAVDVSTNGKVATFRDVDGDIVTVKTTKGVFTGGEFSGIELGANGGGQLQALTLGAAFTGANITITAKPTAQGGNGFVNVGAIEAAGVDLGAVKIAGDLGRLSAGTVGGSVKVPGIKSLTVQSVGMLGTSTQSPVGAKSDIVVEGALAKLSVASDFRNARLIVNGADGKLGAISIGGSLVATTSNTEFTIIAAAGIGSIKIGGDIRAESDGVFKRSVISSSGAIGDIAVAGSMDMVSRLSFVLVTQGQLVAPTAGTNLALKSLKVGGSVRNLVVQAGATFINADASIGSISVGGDWIASTVQAGVGGGADGAAGTADDAKVAGGVDNANVFSTIGSFTVKGQALGTAGVTTDMFGVVAERIGKAKVGGRTFAFTNGATPEAFFAAPTNIGNGAENPAFDFTIREIGSTTPTPAFGGPNLVVSTDGKTATFTDVDGDIVTVKRSAGAFVSGDFTIATVASGGGQLRSLALTAAPGDGFFDLSITAKPGAEGGNGLVNVGQIIHAPTAKVGTSTVAGDIGGYFALGSDGSEPHLRSLSVHSLGRLGTTTGTTGLLVNVQGPLPKFSVGADVHEVEIRVFGNNANLGKLTIGGSFDGSAAQGIGPINVGGTLGELNIRGSFQSGNADGSGAIAAGTIGSLSIGGDLVGSVAVPVEIKAFGKSTVPTAGLDVAIKSVMVKGGMENTRIIAGGTTNADAAIGAISVGRTWLGSSVLAGVQAGTDTFVGTSDDAKVTAAPLRDVATRFSTIASIVIKCQAVGSTAAGDSFGIVAEQIGKAKIGSVILKLDKGERDAADAIAIAPTGPGATGLVSDFFLREITV